MEMQNPAALKDRGPYPLIPEFALRPFPLFTSMRQLLVAVGFLVMLAHSAEGQGTVFFSNITPDFAIEKPVVDASSGYLLGEDYVAQLFAGPAGSSATDLRSVDSPAYFLSLANQPSGIFFGGIVTLPGILPGRIATVEVRVGSAE